MGEAILHNSGKFKGYQGLEFFYRYWTSKEPKGSLVIVHGIGEHSLRYAHVGMHFAKLGYSVYAYDQRGNGRSPGKRGHIKKFDEYVLDLKSFIEYLSLKEKIFILGHSLGGLITIRFAMDYPESAAGIILSSPALGLSMKVPIWKEVVCYLTNLIYPEFALIDNTVPTEYLSHDLAVCRAYDKDPLVHRIRSGRFVVEFMKTIKETADVPQRLKTPCLFLQAGNDKIVSVEALKDFYAKVPAKNKMIKVYPSFYHEILNEIGKEKVFNDIEAWFASLTA